MTELHPDTRAYLFLTFLAGSISFSAAVCSIISLRRLRAVAADSFSGYVVWFITLMVAAGLFQGLPLFVALG